MKNGKTSKREHKSARPHLSGVDVLSMARPEPEAMTPVQPYDPPLAARMEDWCPECVSGGYGHPTYFDVDGREIDESETADNGGDQAAAPEAERDQNQKGK